MAGVVPKRSTSGRKQWTLHDGSRSSLKRLRSQLATDGCPESQVVLAKQLLDDQSELKSERKENERLGVYWLMKASEQGNEEATDLLKQCFKSGKGICELNYLDVKSCITMTQNEKVARRAAREMFASLSNGGEYITSDQLQRKILSIDKEEFSKKQNREFSYYEDTEELTNGEVAKNRIETSDSEEEDESDWSLRSDSSNEKLTEDHLVTASINYSRGHLPNINRALALTKPDLRALDHILFTHRSILHPILVLKIFYYKLIKYVAGKYAFFLSVVRSEIQLFILLFVYSLINSENAFYFVPILLYYLSFLAMVITTFQMLQSQREYLDFRLWTGLFICYSGGSLNPDEAERQYVKNNLKPYGHFFLALLANLSIYSMVSDRWVMQSEISIVAFCLTFMTLFGFMTNNKRRSKSASDVSVLFSFAINVLAKYPYESDPVVTQSWRFLDLKIPNFASYVIGNGIEFCLHFRIVLYAIIPVLFVKIASAENWRGTYRVLIPHCVTLSWLQICIISSQGATMYGLLRGTFALVGTVLFLPMFGLTSVFLPAAAFAKWLITSNALYTISVFIGLSSLGLGACWFLAQTKFRNYVAIFQTVLTVMGILILFNGVVQEHDSLEFRNNEIKPLTWEAFQKFCHHPVWQQENVAVAQINCVRFENSIAHWDGYINDIKIRSIKNVVKTFIESFPKKISKFFKYYYGDLVTDDTHCSNLNDKVKNECREFFYAVQSFNKYSLEKYATYTFEIIVRMQSGIWGKSPEVTLIVEDYFRNFTTKIKPGDHIWFRGILFSDSTSGSDGILGGSKPHIQVEELGCRECKNSKLGTVKMPQNKFDITSIFSYLCNGSKFLLKVLLNPIVLIE